MSNGSKEQEFPDDYRPNKQALSNSEVRATGILCGGAVHNIARGLIEALAQIAALTAQVEALTATIGRMRKANDAYFSALDAANAELAALREGIGVEQYLSMKVRAEASESKLRAESCKHCGPNCIPGAAHNARAEDGVIWTPKPSSRRSHE